MVEFLIFPLKKRIKLEYVQSAELIKFLLIPFVCFWAYGFPDGIGLVELLSGFAAPAFFVISGYFTLSGEGAERSERLKRAVIRDAIFFCILLVFYIAVNILNPLSRAEISLRMLLSKRIWFNFLVLNVWPLPIGDNIWFIQSLLYANIILYFADKLHLLKFYKILLAILTIVMLITGELAGVIGLNLFGYGVFPGNFFTRAIPYLLLGLFLREKYDLLKKFPFWVYLIIFVIGGGLVVGEYYLLYITGKLVYIGHMFGYAIMAIAVCGLMIAWDEMRINPISYYGGRCAKIVYAIFNPIYYIALYFILLKKPEEIGNYAFFGGLIICFVSLIISAILAVIIPVRVRSALDPDELIDKDT